VVRVSQDLLREAALDLGIDPLDTALLNRFQIRDAKIEHLGWALKAEMDHGFSSGRLYADSIGLALASRLLEGHSLARPNGLAMRSAGLPRVMLRRVLAYIEDNLSEDLSLSAISAVAGLSASHCQRTFHNAVGLSVHRYVIQRRVERAKHLLADKRLPISEVAFAVGFSHQSHLACHMQRLLGVSPAGVRKASE
jgi:AraC family transcriptional regulator